jgi:hypothetical protein
MNDIPAAQTAIEKHLALMAKKIEPYTKSMPAVAFTTNPLWREARWTATTFRWHPTSEAPPVMGIVFENAVAGKQLFHELEKQTNHSDRFEEIRVCIIEGSAPGQKPGYTVHICPDPEALAMHATGEDVVVDQTIVPFLGQWNRMYPIPGSQPLLPRFKEEFARHKEFLLAPVVRREDGQNYVEVKLGIMKNSIEFRDLSEIIQRDDIDAAALVLPTLITPRNY